jgi:hypothetical protein
MGPSVLARVLRFAMSKCIFASDNLDEYRITGMQEGSIYV